MKDKILPKKNGRPLKTIENCLPENWKEIIIDLSAQGKSEVQIRAALCMAGGKFNHGTWYALKEREQEFLETLQEGKVLCQSWWENISQENLEHGKDRVFETGAWYANMKNRFGWRDNKEVSFDLENAEQYFKTIADVVRGRDNKDA